GAHQPHGLALGGRDPPRDRRHQRPVSPPRGHGRGVPGARTDSALPAAARGRAAHRDHRVGPRPAVTPPPARVVYLNSSADIGGGEKWMLALASGLDRARYASAFVVPHEGRFADEARRRGFPVTVVDLEHLVSPRALVALTRHLRRARPHLLHTAGARASFYGRVAARVAGVPAIVSSVHTSIADFEVP